jgi:hypothetical protein
MSDTKTFSIHVIGETTGKTWAGEFEARLFLSQRLKLERDRVLRSLLGTDPQFSLEIDRAAKIADCHVGIVKGPEFWTASTDGLDFVDDKLLEAIHDGMQLAQKEARAAITKAAEDAKKALTAELKTPQEPAAE